MADARTFEANMTATIFLDSEVIYHNAALSNAVCKLILIMCNTKQTGNEWSPRQYAIRNWPLDGYNHRR